MIVTLKPGENVKVEFADSDGSVKVAFNEKDVTVTAGMPDSDGRIGIIYQERFGEGHDAVAYVKPPLAEDAPLRLEDIKAGDILQFTTDAFAVQQGWVVPAVMYEVKQTLVHSWPYIETGRGNMHLDTFFSGGRSFAGLHVLKKGND